jgi:Fe-S oxidoreductase
MVLHNEIEEDTPLVGLEPACVSDFSGELLNLSPNDRLTRKLKDNTRYIAGFIMHELDHFPLHRVPEKARIHIHCHHHAGIKAQGEREMLEHLGLDFEVLQSGCCGMAGGFGFEAEAYEVSQQIAERSLFPTLRAADRNAWMNADGFSCREQIEQGVGRRTLRIAEFAAAYLRQGN